MKWKRSKKAQQEAKEKKSTSSSSASSSGSPSSSSSSSSSSGSSSTVPVNGSSMTTAPSSSDGVDHHLLPAKTAADSSRPPVGHPNSFSVQKTIGNMDPHRHIVNLSSNLSDFSNLEENVNSSKLTRRPLLFATDANQNGDMFRPYVV